MRSIPTLFKDTFRQLKIFFLKFFIVLLPPTAYPSVFYFLDNLFKEPTPLISLILIFTGVLVFAFSSAALINLAHDSSLNVGASYGRVGLRVIPYIGLLVFVNFIFLLLVLMPAAYIKVVPVLFLIAFPFISFGVFLTVSFSFSPFILLLDKKSIAESMKLSFRLVKGNWWKIFMRVVAVFVFIGILTLAVQFVIFALPANIPNEIYFLFGAAINIFVWCTSTLFMYEVYKDLKQLKSVPVT